MADSVNTQALNLIPLDGSGLNSAKSSNSSLNNGDREAFSRVLDQQRERDATAGRAADRQSAAAAQGGNALPPERSTAADSAGSADTASPADGELAGESSSGAVGLVKEEAAIGPLSNLRPVADQARDAAGVKATASQAEGLTLTAEKGAAVAGTDPRSPLGSLQSPEFLRSDAAGELRASEASRSTSLDSLAANLPANAASSIAQPDGSPGLRTAEQPGIGATPELAAAPLKGAESALAAETLPGAVPAAGIRPATGAEISLAQSAVSAPAVGEGVESGVSAGAALLNSEAEAATRGSAGGATGALARANGEALESAGQIAQDNNVLTRSRADWLRGGVGSEASPLSPGADVQIDDLIDAPRPMLAARADAAPPSMLTPLASSIAGMTPATASAAAPMSSAAQAGQHLFLEYALNHAPQDPDFPGELTARMKTLLRDGVREARLQLHPAELGRLSVTVSTDGDQARVSFIADTAAARDAIEQSMPRLREMLEQNGLQLAQSDVGQRDLQGGRDGADAERSVRPGDAGDNPAESEVPEELVSHRSSARIDTYI